MRSVRFTLTALAAVLVNVAFANGQDIRTQELILDDDAALPGNRHSVTLRAPVDDSLSVNYAIRFPNTTGLDTGSMFYVRNWDGTTADLSWLVPRANSYLTSDSSGVPTWDDLVPYTRPGEWTDADSIGLSGFIFANQALSGGTNDTVIVSDDGSFGVGTTTPDALVTLRGENDLFTAYDNSSTLRTILNDDGEQNWYLGNETGDMGRVRIGQVSGYPSFSLFRPGNIDRFNITNRSLYTGLGYAADGSDTGSVLSIAQGGNVGVGTAAPSNKLHVTAGADPLRLEGLVADTTLDSILVVDATGVVHMRTVTLVNGAVDTTFIEANAWLLEGNSGTVDGTNFLGTTDDVPLTLRANDVPSFRIEPRSNAPNILGNPNSNSVAASTEGASIGGGAQNTSDTGDYVTIGGGLSNVASLDYATVGGGNQDSATGYAATVAGGETNVATATHSSISGGGDNRADGSYSSVLGGRSNTASGNNSSILGGRGLTLSGTGSVGFLGGNSGSNDMLVSSSNVALIGNVDLWLANNDSSARAMRFYEPVNSTGSFPSTFNYSSFQAQPQDSTIQYLLPDTAGIQGDFLAVSNVAGNTLTLDWRYVEIVPGAVDTTYIEANAWLLTGNAGTVDGTNFLGTTDSVALTFRTNDSPSLRIAPTASDPNLLANPTSNSAVAGSTGGAIVGGGENTVDGADAAVLGGRQNDAAGTYTSVLGGRGLTLSGDRSVGFLGGNTGSNDMSVSASDVALLGNVDLWLANNDSSARAMRFYEPVNSTGSFPSTFNYSSFQAQPQDSTIQYLLPDTAGIAGDFLAVSAVAGNTLTLDWRFVQIVPGAVDTTFIEANAWLLEGNIGTVDGTNFLGTTDSVALTMRTNDSPSLRIEPTGSDPNVISNPSSNSVVAGSAGGVISGGGENTIDGTDAAVLGGRQNDAAGSNTSVLGGRGLTLSGDRSVGFLGGNTGSNDMSVSASDVALFGNVDLWLANNDSTARAMRFYEPANATGAFPSTFNFSSFESQPQDASIRYLLPDTAGVVGDVLTVQNVSGTTLTLNWNNADSAGGAVAWLLTGNSGTTVGTNFLGTTDDEPMEIRVNDSRVMRYDPRSTSPNITGGYEGNFIPTTEDGNVISGGGQLGSINQTGTGVDFATIAGGRGNEIIDNADHATISGGEANVVTEDSDYGVIGGGRENFIESNADYSSIPGGRGLTLQGSGSFGFLGGNGGANDMTIADDNVSVLANTDLWLANNNSTPSRLVFYDPESNAGTFPATSQFSSFEAQDQVDDIRYLLPDTAGWAGDVLGVQSIVGQTVTLDWTEGAGGRAWLLEGNAGTSVGTNFLGTTDDEAMDIRVNNERVMRYEPSSTSPQVIGGFNANSVQVSQAGNVIAGGGQSGQLNSTGSGVDFSVVGGGAGNQLSGSADYSVIGGGEDNVIDNGASWSVLSGGQENAVAGEYGVVSGGFRDSVSGDYSAVSGGVNNKATGNYSAVAGGAGLELGDNSFGFNAGDTASSRVDLSAQDSVAYFGNVDLWVGNTDSSASRLRFVEPNTSTDYSGTHYSSIRARLQDTNINYVLPDTAGVLDDVLTVRSIAGDDVFLDWTSANEARAVGQIIFVRKTADETSTSRSLQDDDHLFLSLDSGKSYEISGALYTKTNNSQANFDLAFDVPTGSTMLISFFANESKNGNSNKGADIRDTDATGATNGTGYNEVGINTNWNVIHFKGLLVMGSSSGDIELMWCGDANTITVYKNSYMRASVAER